MQLRFDVSCFFIKFSNRDLTLNDFTDRSSQRPDFNVGAFVLEHTLNAQGAY